MKWKIVCDSSCDLTSAVFLPGKLELEVIPLTLRVGQQEYRDDEALHVETLLRQMKEETGPSGTACPSPADFAAAFAGADCSLCFTLSGQLSGTCAAAHSGRRLALEEAPEKQIFVLDSGSTSGALVLLVRKARALIEQGVEDFSELCHQLQAAQKELRTVFTLETFDNLVKNGRMRPLLGNLLHTFGIHVVAEATREGTIHVVGKAKGESRTIKAMLDYMRQQKDCQDAEVVISHCANLDGAQRLKEKIQQQLPVRSVTTLACRGLTSFYAMEKGLIVAF